MPSSRLPNVRQISGENGLLTSDTAIKISLNEKDQALRNAVLVSTFSCLLKGDECQKRLSPRSFFQLRKMHIVVKVTNP